MRKALSFLAIALGLACLLLAGYLYWENRQEETLASGASEEILAQFHSQLEHSQLENPDDAATTDSLAITVDGVQYMGILTIPNLELLLPVASSYSDAQLNISPCVYSGSLEDTTLLIGAHNYEAHFADIHSLVPGDALTLEDAQGILHQYVLMGQETIDETDLDGLFAGQWDLSLFTCLYGDNTQRVVLRFQYLVM